MFNSAAEDMLTLTCCQDHILTENIWFVCSETSYSGDVTDAGQTNKRQTLKIELLSQAESRNLESEGCILTPAEPPYGVKSFNVFRRAFLD